MILTLKRCLFIIFLSIILSLILATSINLEKDEVGALLNIFLPLIIGIITLLLIIMAFVISKDKFYRTLCFFACICMNLTIGIYLNLRFNSFANIVFNYNHLVSRSNNTLYFSTIRNKDGSDKIDLRNPDGFPSTNYLSFSLVAIPWKSALGRIRNSEYNANHNKAIVRVTNFNDNDINIIKAIFSNNNIWKISAVNGMDIDQSVFPVKIKAGSYADFTVEFTAKMLTDRVKPAYWKYILNMQYMLTRNLRLMKYQTPFGSTCETIKGDLKFLTDFKNTATKPIYLNAIWQYKGESDWEPPLRMVLENFNIKTKVGFQNFDNGLNGDSLLSNSDEIFTCYFQRANDNASIKIMQLASYHGCCLVTDADSLQCYAINDKQLKTVIRHQHLGGQMILPQVFTNTGTGEYSYLNMSKPFGLKVGSSYSDRKMNYKNKIGLRIWKVVDNNNVPIDNAYLLGSDYLGTGGTNYDYQDNVYLIENVKPFSVASARFLEARSVKN